MKKVLVIVVTHNGMRWLERCLSSVAGDGRPEPAMTDVYVLDNDSTDGSADYIQAHFPQVHLVRSAENLGFTGGNNLGIQYALERGYDYVYLLNQDAWLEEGALEKLVAAAEAHPEYAVLSPLQMTDGFTAFDTQFAKLYRPGAKTAQNAPGSDKNDVPGAKTAQIAPGTVEVKRVMAAHWLVPVDAIRKIGLFSELFPYYGQDDDWCNRARYHGYRIAVVPQARAVHDRARRQESRERIIDRNYRVGSLIRLCDINRPLWERFLFVCLFTLVKAVKYRSLQPFKHFRSLCKQLPQIRAHRSKARLPL